MQTSTCFFPFPKMQAPPGYPGTMEREFHTNQACDLATGNNKVAKKKEVRRVFEIRRKKAPGFSGGAPEEGHFHVAPRFRTFYG